MRRNTGSLFLWISLLAIPATCVKTSSPALSGVSPQAPAIGVEELNSLRGARAGRSDGLNPGGRAVHLAGDPLPDAEKVPPHDLLDVLV
jgi:hypothetical protein